MNLEGRIAMVTGAATGIGAALANGLAASGAHVVGADINWSAESETVSDVQRAVCDVTDEADVRNCIHELERSKGSLDILVNNAAIASVITPKPFHDITTDEWKQMLIANTIAPFICCKAVVPRMREKHWGRIINLTSAGIFFGLPNMLHYAASKGAIASMTRSLAKDLAPHGITVNGIAPGLVMTRRIQLNPAFDDALIAQSVDAQAIPVREQPEDLVGACLYIASDAARMMTGQTITVDGGTAFS